MVVTWSDGFVDFEARNVEISCAIPQEISSRRRGIANGLTYCCPLADEGTGLLSMRCRRLSQTSGLGLLDGVSIRRKFIGIRRLFP